MAELSTDLCYMKTEELIYSSGYEKIFKSIKRDTNEIFYWHEIFLCMDDNKYEALVRICDYYLHTPGYTAWNKDTGNDIIKRLTYFVITPNSSALLR